ncbi:hypothetical protein FP2506_09196 [Fulvimarina pelagi HTCC2506]|uniref:Uncharacterized protein n=1 Tax=Fulvimarina pelagi HTCC2506 TaxID=314231 RepID=Q0G5Q7_9HYPH|nr:hypothetical protein FP2506_09196 [Fulvimarina pelagi HTCC2506]
MFARRISTVIRWNGAERFLAFKRLVGEHQTPSEIAVRFLGTTTFRFMLLAVAISGVAFAVRSSDAFQTVQFAAINAETKRQVAGAAQLVNADRSAATQIAAAEPRLLKTVALERVAPEPKVAEPVKPAEPEKVEETGIVSASPDTLCETLGNGAGGGKAAVWEESPLFAGENECYASQNGEGFSIAQIARGPAGAAVDTIRIKLDLEDEKAADDASEVLTKELDEALSVGKVTAPSGFVESVARLEDAKATAGALAFNFEREVGAANRFNLVIQKTSDDKNRRLVQQRP